MAKSTNFLGKLKGLKKPAMTVYPILIVLAIPLLLAINTIWNLRSFNRDANFFIRHQAVSIADTLKPLINENIKDPQKLRLLLANSVNSNEDLVAITLLSYNNSDFEIVVTTHQDEGGQAQKSELNQMAIGFDEPFAGLVYDPNLQENVWSVSVPQKLDDGNTYLTVVKLNTQTVNEILGRTSRDSFIILGILILVTIILLINHLVFYKKSLRTQQLEEIDRLKDEFISMAAHELRTPMTGLVGYLDLLRDKISPEQLPALSQDLDTLDMLTRDLNGLINDLLDVSRIEQGRLKVNITDVAVNDVVKILISTMKPSIDKKGLSINFAPGELPSIKSDPDRIHQVIGNLMTNAIKYTLKGEITVSTYLKDKYVYAEVKDTGIGIPANEIPNLFTKFHRVKDEKTKEVRGTGLGLWITKQIVEILGGNIYAESIYGTGTRIFFTLPVNVG